MTDSLESKVLSQIIDSLPTGTILVDRSGRIVMLNDTVVAWFGYDRDEILGQTVECLIPERFLTHHHRYRDEYFAKPRVRPMGVNQDLYARRKDGSEFPCDISLHPLPLASGLHVMLHMVDATQRQQSEARQRHEESLRRMQFIVENLPAGATYVSLETQTMTVNRTFEMMTGYHQDEVVDLSTAFRLLFRDRAEEIQRIHDEDQQAGFPTPRELLIHRKDGRRAWVEIAAYRYKNHEVWLWHDITERLANQERLVRSERLAAIGEMITGLAHESRNALQRARSSLEMLGLDLAEQPALQALSQRSLSALDELQRLYEEVRNYAAPIQIERRKMDLKEIWQDVWGQVQQLHPSKQISVTWHGIEESRGCPGDPYRIHQVFRNILENATAVLPDQGGAIDAFSQLVHEDGKTWIDVAIQDSGPGMNEEQKTRIFEPFFTTKTRGTGLGMAIVRRIMEAHGGTISVGSPERGAQIILRFPFSPSQNS